MGHSDTDLTDILQSPANTVHLSLQDEAGQFSWFLGEFESACNVSLTESTESLASTLLLQLANLTLNLAPLSECVSVGESELRLLVSVRIDAVDQAVYVALQWGLEVDLECFGGVAGESGAFVQVLSMRSGQGLYIRAGQRRRLDFHGKLDEDLVESELVLGKTPLSELVIAKSVNKVLSKSVCSEVEIAVASGRLVVHQYEALVLAETTEEWRVAD